MEYPETTPTDMHDSYPDADARLDRILDAADAIPDPRPALGSYPLDLREQDQHEDPERFDPH